MNSTTMHRPTPLLTAILLAAAMTAHAQSVEVVPWTWMNPLPQGNDLRDVRVLPDHSILGIGNGGMLLRSSDGGSTWSTQLYPAGLRSLYAIDFPTQTLGYISGDDHERVGKIARTTDGGASWSVLPTTSFATLSGLHFLDADRGAAVGTAGTFLSTTDGGSSWTQGSVGVITDLTSVDFEFSFRAMAAGSGGKVYRTNNGGANWSTENTGSTNIVRSVLTRSSTAIAVGDGGLLAHKSTDLTSWTSIVSPLAGASFRSVHWLKDAVAIAVGSSGTAIRTDTWGLSWYDISTSATTTLNAIHAYDSTLAVAVGDGGAITRTTDGGMSWTNLSSGPTTTLNDVTITPSRTRVAVGNSGKILRQSASDAGWVERPSGVTTTLLGVHAIDNDIVLAVGNNRILRSVDSGMLWDSVPFPATSNLRRVTSRNGVTLAVGTSGVILRSTDDGMGWQTMESGVTFALRAVAFASDSIAVCIGSAGTIRRSTNAGVSWDSIPSPKMATLSSVAFENELHGFIVGSALDLGLTGTLLETTDGGLSWSARSLAVPVDIGPAFLSYDAIGFRDPDEWLFAANAGLFYRSTNGGSTWTRLLTGTTATTNGLAWAGDRWIAVGSGGMVLESPFDPSLSVKENDPSVPRTTVVLKAYPNPFNPATTIVVASNRSAHAKVEVYDLLGRHVATLFEGTLRPDAPQSFRFDASGLPSGTYFVASVSGDSRSILPLLLLR